ncbi:uroporphyrinogen decarboxylase family protein [Chloroflexota bacterium]
MAKQYTGKERIEAIFRREQADRIPVVLALTNQLALQAGFQLNECRLDPEKAWKALVLAEEMLPTDMVTVTGNPYASDVIQARWESTHAPGVRQGLPLADKSSLKTFHHCPAKEDELYITYIEMAKRTISRFPDHAIYASSRGPWTTAGTLRGEEQLIYDTTDDPQFVHELMQVTAGISIDRTLAMAATGVYPRITDPSAGCSLISPKIYREFVKPYHELVCQRLHQDVSTRVGLHICGYVDPIMEDIVTLPIDWFELDALSSLEKMVSLSQGKLVIRGQVSTEIFIEGTEEKMDEEVKRIVDTAARTSPLILAPGCSVPYNTSVENMRYFLEAAHRYGSYDYINASR